jgi:hypothetical protein
MLNTVLNTLSHFISKIIDRPEIMIFIRFLFVLTTTLIIIFLTWYFIWNSILKHYDIFVEIFSSPVKEKIKPIKVIEDIKLTSAKKTNVIFSSHLSKSTSNNNKNNDKNNEKKTGFPSSHLSKSSPQIPIITYNNIRQHLDCGSRAVQHLDCGSRAVQHLDCGSRAVQNPKNWKDKFGNPISINENWF